LDVVYEEDAAGDRGFDLDLGWVAYALGAALAYLPASAMARETTGQRAVEAGGERCRYLGGWVKTAPNRAESGGRDWDDRTAEQVRWGEPVDPVGHQLRDGEQLTELERSDQVASDALVRCRGPGAVEAGRTGAGKRRRGRQAPAATVADDCVGTTGASASRA
jgi:hypothetical protein